MKFKANRNYCVKVFNLVLEHLKLKPKADIEFSLTLADNIQNENEKHRKIASDTNVLTLSLYKDREMLLQNLEKMPVVILGDIFFSYEKLEIEANEQGKMIDDHFMHLLIHSYLHLLCYDHIKKKEQNEMEKIEIDILDSVGIGNPYI
ncbi:MAG: hypothetical protein Ta2D_03840 [Rickettsiales bacterium]|nr:MAG: hypothetical protein Ta2D_03840 [Rickettsiales bacterium]